ncbi:MAG TPA: carboxypeptidase-like regulatory domain-containing protein, partial [Longimicrobiales bacterium]
TGATTGSGSVDTDTGEGTLYWVVTTSSTAPSAAQVQAGTDENDTAAADSGSQAVIATGTQAITGGFTGLSAGTTYYAHYQHQDAAENDSAVASSSAFTTHSAITGDAAGTSSDSGTADLAISITGEASGTSSDSGTVTQTYSISGTVTSSGEAVEGALIYLIDQSSDSVIDTETTGADGTYSFTGLSAGTYHAAVEYEGFAAPSVSFIKLGGD